MIKIMKKQIITQLLILGALASHGYAAIGLTWDGNSSWVGDGAVDTSPVNGVVVTGFSGSANANDVLMTRDGTLVNYSIDLIPWDGNQAHSADFEIIGATGTVLPDLTTAPVGTVLLKNLTNVKGFSITAGFEDPLGVTGAFQVFGNSMSLIGGTGESVMYDHINGGIIEVPPNWGTNPGGPAQFGLSADTPFYVRPQTNDIGNDVVNILEGTAPAGADSWGVFNETLNTDATFVGLAAMDSNRDGRLENNNIFPNLIGDFNNDVDQIYITSSRFNVMDSDGQALNSGAQFRFTLEGTQFPESIELARDAVPEPSSVSLFGLATLGVLLRRRRG